jgi:hypothetical protein
MISETLITSNYKNGAQHLGSDPYHYETSKILGTLDTLNPPLMYCSQMACR